MKTLFLSLLIFLSLSSNAQFVDLDWAHSLGANRWDNINVVVVDDSGNVYTEGIFRDTVDFDPGPGSFLVNTALNTTEHFIQKRDAAGNLLWVKQFDTGLGVDTIPGELMVVDRDRNIYLSQQFTGTVDLDPGPGVFNLTATTGWGFDVFVLKLDPDGNFLWAKQIGGPADDRVGAIAVDSSGNVYTSGNFYGPVDFDPGPGRFDLTASTIGDVYVQKLDSAGNLVWAHQYGNANFDRVHKIEISREQNLILHGCFEGTVDFDPGPASFMLSSLNDTYDVYTLSLDQAGNFLWATQIRSTLDMKFSVMELDQAGNIYTVGPLLGNIDLDPGPDSVIIVGSNTGRERMFIQKINKNGQYDRQLIIGNTGQGQLGVLDVGADQTGNIYLTGTFNGTVDLDPSLGTQTLSATFGFTKPFIAKYNSFGNFVWARDLETNASPMFRSFTVDPTANIYFAGGFVAPIDVHPGPGSLLLSAQNGNPDMYLVKWKQDSCSGLSSVVNRVDDVTCGVPGFVTGIARGGRSPYSYSWNTTPATNLRKAQITTPGIYTLTVTDAAACNTSSQVLVNGIGNTTPLDLQINVTSTIYRPGRRSFISINASNRGCAPTDGEVVLVLDNFMTYSSSTPAPDTIIGGRKLIWRYTGLNDVSGQFRARVAVDIDVQAQGGDQLCVTPTITAQGGGNNTKFSDQAYCRVVRNSLDPNDKQVYPKGTCEPGYIDNDEVLTYTLRFQNTGNASAIDIFLLDTLSDQLDLASVRVVGQSHEPMVTEVLPDRVLKFRFDNIYLPDSTTDEPKSNGYVMFEASPVSNLPINTEIRNSGSIYFDFNKPVKTNTVLNTIIDVVPQNDTSFRRVNSCTAYTLNRRIYDESGVYTQVFSRPGNCDSVIMLTLNLRAVDTSITQIGATLTSNEGGAHGLDASYQWVDCDKRNMPIAGATQQNFTPTENGNYAVRIKKGTCEVMSACVNVSTVGIDPDFQDEIKYYPNPSTSLLHIDLGKSYAVVEVEVFNVIGEKVKLEKREALDKFSIDLPKQRGLYFIRIQVEGRSAMLKVIKE